MHMVRALLPQLHDCWEQLHPQQPGFTSNAVNNSFTKPGKCMLQQLLLNLLCLCMAMTYLLSSCEGNELKSSQTAHHTSEGG